MQNPFPEERNRRFRIVISVLNSKRLLVDHVELLDDYLALRKINSVDDRWRYLDVTLSSLGVVSSVSLAVQEVVSGKHFGIYFGAALAGLSFFGYTSLRGWSEILHSNRDERIIHDLLRFLSQYHRILKNNLTYLTDLVLLNETLSERDLSLCGASFQSIVRVVKYLHQHVTELDNGESLEEILPNYQPFEDLGNCVFLNVIPESLDMSHLKEVYKIFLYIQSQFVLRIAVDLVEKGDSEERKKLLLITRDLDGEVKRTDLQILPKISGGAQQLSQFLANNQMTNQNKELLQLRNHSANLSTKLFVQVEQFIKFNGKLAEMDEVSSKQVERLIGDLGVLECLMLENLREFDDLQIMTRKLLNKDVNKGEEEKKETNTLNVNKKEEDEVPRKIVDQNSSVTIDDEFFVLDGQQEKQEGPCDNSVDDTRNERVLKSSFKPVLKQLRKEIDSLNEEMEARERKYLEQQGINLDGIVKPPPPLNDSSTESSEEELDENMILRKKKKPTTTIRPSKYDENRKFLEEKVQCGMIRLPIPVFNVALGEEEVLE